MFRITGLPPVARYPEATSARDAENLLVRFGGLGEEQTLVVPLKYVGGDAEEAELRLLAQLQQIGYDARRAT
jgi:hypothetical protein